MTVTNSMFCMTTAMFRSPRAQLVDHIKKRVQEWHWHGQH
jgi:hypothetical protein